MATSDTNLELDLGRTEETNFERLHHVKAPRGGRGAGQAIGYDLDIARRPGYRSYRGLEKLANTQYPPKAQRSDVEVLMHARPHKTFPPVFGTDVPPRGLSGKVRRAAYAYPDHVLRHWLMLLFADRVDSWGHRAKKVLPIALPALGLAFLATRRLRDRRGARELALGDEGTLDAELGRYEDGRPYRRPDDLGHPPETHPANR